MFSSKLCFQLIGSQYVLLDPSEVLFLEADRQVCHISLADGNKLVAVRHLGYYKQELLQSFQFIELSKSLLINVLHIAKYLPRDRNVQLSSGQTLTVAKSRQEALNKIFRDMHDRWKQEGNEQPELEQG